MNYKILIVIVFYKESIKNSIAYNSLLKAKQLYSHYFKIYIHDNSPDKQNVMDSDVYYIHSQNNVGLSKAYNKAAEYAKENNFDWLLLSDQDTYYPLEILNDYIKAIRNNPEIKLIVPKVITTNGLFLSPFKYKHKRGISLKCISSGELYLKGLSVINSGILINLESFFKCGGYNEKTPIDFSDHQFIERLKQIESKFYIINNEITQDFSNETNDIDKLYNRLIRIIDAAKNCERYNIFDNLDYFMLLLRHAIALFIRTGKLRFIKCFIVNYWIV